MLKGNGILLFAVGHPYYGRMAYSLAVTIKAIEPDAQITVVQSKSSLAHLSEDQKEYFDNIVTMPSGAPVGCGSKLWADVMTPYENTLVLDVDMLWLPKRKPSDLFKELDEVDFTAITEGYHPDNLNSKYFLWADASEIYEKYEITADRLYQWRSEVMYFKTEKVGQLFEKAREVYLKPGLSTEKLYANGTADELGLVVACGVLDIHPHKYLWIPAYWHLMNGGHVPDMTYLCANYYLASFGANHASIESKKLYDRLMKSACYTRGVQHVFPLISKKEFLPERQLM